MLTLSLNVQTDSGYCDRRLLHFRDGSVPVLEGRS